MCTVEIVRINMEIAEKWILIKCLFKHFNKIGDSKTFLCSGK